MSNELLGELAGSTFFDLVGRTFGSFTVSVTATELGAWPPSVLVSVTGLTLGDAVELYRVVAGERTAVRAGTDPAVTDTSFLRTDAELPFGVPVEYLALVNGSTEYWTSAVTHTLPGGKVAITDAVSGLAAEVVVLAWGDSVYGRTSSVFPVGGRNVAVLGPMGQYTSTLELFLENTSSVENVRTVLDNATAGTVQIRQPGGYDGVDSYLAVLQATVRRFSQDGSDPRRVYALDVAQVEGWAPDLEDQGATLQGIADAYDGLTLNDLSGDYATLLAVAEADWSMP
jgi:hypothetical protein